MELMFANAETFNQEGSETYLDSLRLRAVYAQAMAAVRAAAPCPDVEPIPADELPALAIAWHAEPAAEEVDRCERHERQCELMDQEYHAAEVTRKRLRGEMAATDDAHARLRSERHALERQIGATRDAVRLMTQQVAGLGRTVEAIQPLVVDGEAACGEMVVGLQTIRQVQQGLQAVVPRFTQLGQAVLAFFRIN
jgi:phage shock protein A